MTPTGAEGGPGRAFITGHRSSPSLSSHRQCTSLSSFCMLLGHIVLSTMKAAVSTRLRNVTSATVHDVPTDRLVLGMHTYPTLSPCLRTRSNGLSAAFFGGCYGHCWTFAQSCMHGSARCSFCMYEREMVFNNSHKTP